MCVYVRERERERERETDRQTERARERERERERERDRECVCSERQRVCLEQRFSRAFEREVILCFYLGVKLFNPCNSW